MRAKVCFEVYSWNKFHVLYWSCGQRLMIAPITISLLVIWYQCKKGWWYGISRKKILGHCSTIIIPFNRNNYWIKMTRCSSHVLCSVRSLVFLETGCSFMQFKQWQKMRTIRKNYSTFEPQGINKKNYCSFVAICHKKYILAIKNSPNFFFYCFFGQLRQQRQTAAPQL